MSTLDSWTRSEPPIRDAHHVTLDSYTQSEMAPASCMAAVQSIVGHDFEERVIHSAQHALVVFHTPFGVNCQTFLEKYERVGLSKRFRAPVGSTDAKASDELVFARVDATLNDVARFVALDFNRLPTVMLFKAGAKDAPVTFAGDSYEVADMLTFVRQNCGDII